MPRKFLLLALLLPVAASAAPRQLVDECDVKTLAIQESFDLVVDKLRQTEELQKVCISTGVFEARSALLYADARRLKKAEVLIAAAEQFSPRYDKEVLVAKMSLAVPQGQKELALRLGEEVTRRYPEWPDGYHAFAMAHFWHADFKSSIAMLDRANEIAESAKGHRLLAIMNHLEENHQEAVNALERAISIDANAILDASAVAAASLSLLELDRREEGWSLLERYASLDPGAEAKYDYNRARDIFNPKPRNRAGDRAMISSVSPAERNKPAAALVFSNDLADLADTDESDRPSGPPVPEIDPSKPRSNEEIQYVFHKNRGAIFALYNRALRRDPKIEGLVIFRLTILPNGRVETCEIAESEIEDEKLLEKMRSRFKLLQFEPLNVSESTTILFPIEFFPA